MKQAARPGWSRPCAPGGSARRAPDVGLATKKKTALPVHCTVCDVSSVFWLEHRVVRLDARRGDLRARPDREGDLRLLTVVDGEALEEQAAETGPGAAAAPAEMFCRVRCEAMHVGSSWNH